MSWPTIRWAHVQISRSGGVTRRSFFLASVGGLAGSWLKVLALRAAERKSRPRSCILLWMGGGPSQLESFDPKPEAPTGGGVRAIATAVPGVFVAEYWPRTAGVMKELAVIRSVTGIESSHQRATYHMHTGYVPSSSVRHPSFGSLVASEIAPEEAELPHVVSIGGPTHGASFLGAEFEPFVVEDPRRKPANLDLPPGTSEEQFLERLELLRVLEEQQQRRGRGRFVMEHQATYEKASRLVRSKAVQVFDLDREPRRLREAYGWTVFGQGCLLARRLVEAGVTFVEVRSTGWDTHRDHFEKVPYLCAQVDPALATLIEDLKTRGLLESTLVIWTGEFGRTPRVNPYGGRDHWPQAFSVVVAGAGIPGGVVVGQTNWNGSEVKDRPVTIPDLFATFCKALQIAPEKEYTSPQGRPLKIVDRGQPVQELFS